MASGVWPLPSDPSVGIRNRLESGVTFMVLTYRTSGRLCAAVFALLTACLLMAPGLVYALFDLQGSEGADVLARRSGLLLAGLAYLMWICAGHPPNPTRRCVTTSLCLIMASLAGLGAVEWARGAVGAGVWSAIAVELSLVALLWAAERRDSLKGDVT